MAISNRVGPPVVGDDFYGRVQELLDAHSLLDANHSLVLCAPRRIGKSSFAKRLIEDKLARGWKCIYIDLEGVDSRDGFLQTLIEGFEKSGIWKEATAIAGGVANRIIEGIKGIGPVKLDFSTSESVANLYSELAKVINHAVDTLIVIDELPLFLGIIDKEDASHRETGFLLNWFRSLRQVTGTKVRWIFCGSVGLHNFTGMRNLSMSINDMVPFEFDALSKQEAEGLLKALAFSEHLPISEEIVKYFLDKLGWPIPYFIQLLFTNIKNLPSVGNGISENMVDEVFDKLALSNEFSTWSERLAEYNHLESGARLILKLLCQSDKGATRDQLLTAYCGYMGISPMEADHEFSLIINMIEQDGYILRCGGGVRRFRSPLLKKWWYNKFVE